MGFVSVIIQDNGQKEKRKGDARLLMLMIIYWLLAARITVRTDAAICGFRGDYYIEAGLSGISFRSDRKIDLLAQTEFLKSIGSQKKIHVFSDMMRFGRFESVSVQMCLGLADAAQSAVAAGAVRAVILSAASGLSIPLFVDVRPDFTDPCFMLTARGIYSFCVGDIILTAANARIRKRKRDSDGKASH